MNRKVLCVLFITTVLGFAPYSGSNPAKLCRSPLIRTQGFGYPLGRVPLASAASLLSSSRMPSMAPTDGPSFGRLPNR